MNWPSFWEERDQNSFVTFFSIFEWLSHRVCMQAGMWTRGSLLRYQKAVRSWDGSLPLHSSSLRGPCCCPQCQSSVFSTPVLGQTHYMQPKTRAQKKSCGPQPGRVESWRCCLGPSSSWRCHAGGSLVANQGWAKFMCLFQTSWKTARGRGFEEWGILDMWCEHSLMLFCMLAGLSSSPLMLFSSRTPRFMQQRRLSILAQKTELHCLLILVSHHFQIQVHKIKDEKHVVLVLALQKGKKIINEVLQFSLCIRKSGCYYNMTTSKFQRIKAALRKKCTQTLLGLEKLLLYLSETRPEIAHPQDICQ